MKTAILVLTCDKAKYTESRRKQWENCLKDANVPVFYVFGKTETTPSIPVGKNVYRIMADVTDSYETIPYKLFYAYNMLRNFFDAIIKIDDNIHIVDIVNTLENVKDELKTYPYLQLISGNEFPPCVTNSHYGRSHNLNNMMAIIPKCHYAGGSAYALRFDAMTLFDSRDFLVSIFEDVDVGYRMNKSGVYPHPSITLGKFIDTEVLQPRTKYAVIEALDKIVSDNYNNSLNKSCSVLVRGGLGNQLFMICTALAYCIRTNSRLRLVWEKSEWRPQYFDTLLRRFAPYLDTTMPSENTITYLEYQDKKFSFVRLPYTQPHVNLNLIGYFQSSKYFPELKDIIHLLPDFPESKAVDDIMEGLGSKIPVILHVRRTDYVPKSNIHYVQPLDYYERAIAIIRENVSNPHFLLISDDVPFLSNIPIKQDESQIVDLDDIQTMKLMSKCRHFIIANSTFSWWGSVFGRSKLVVAPKIWFGPDGPQDWQDIYEDGWLVI
jgi:hypothetical protein